LRFYDSSQKDNTGRDKPFGEKIELKVRVVKPKPELSLELQLE